MKKIIIGLVALLATFGSTNGQTLTLDNCINRALENSVRVKQQKTQVQINEANLQDARDARRPTAQAGLSQGLNFGRSIDPYTNSFSSQNIAYNNVGINGSYTLYDGGQNKLLINERALLLEAEKYGVTSEKEQLTLQVILAYTQVLASQEALNQAESQAGVTKGQITSTKRLIESGILPGTHLIDLRAQLANDQYGIVNAKSQLSDSRLVLSQLMVVSLDSIKAVMPISPKEKITSNYSDDLLQSVLNNHSSIKAIDSKIAASGLAIQYQKTAKKPSVSLQSSLGTNFSSAARSLLYGSEMKDVNTGAYVNLEGQQLPVYAVTVPSSYERIGYFNQLTQNINASVVLQVSIPLGIGKQVRNKTLLATYKRDLLQHEHKLQEQNLKQGIEKAINQVNLAKDRYLSIKDNVGALQESFSSAKSKLNAGTINAIEYSQTKSIFDKASLQLIQAKYEWIMRNEVVNFYLTL